MTKKLLIISGILAIAATALFAFQTPSPPKLTWSPGQLDVSLAPGSTKTMEAAFVSSYRLPSVVLQASLEISRFVSVQLTSSSTVSGGHRYVLRAVVSAPAATQVGVYQGNVGIRIGNLTLPQTLKVVITVLPVGVSSLPPDPGEAGKKTLAGIDSDRDGVRDDVQRKIAFAAPESERKREGMKQLARALQPYILASSETEAKARNVEIQRAMKCLRSYLDLQTAPNTFASVESFTLNTEDRLRAYFRLEKLKGTTSGYSGTSTVCTFDPSSLRN